MSESFKNNVYPKVMEYLRAQRLRDALVLLKAMSVQANTRSISDSIASIEETYMALLGYLTRGAADPTREEMYNTLIADTYKVLDRLTRHVMSRDTPSLYYDALRMRRRLRDTMPSLSRIFADYRSALSETSLFNLITDEKNEAAEASTVARENLEDAIFNYVWTVYPLEGEDAVMVHDAVVDTSLPAVFRASLISAVSLGLMEFCDDERFIILADCVDLPSPDLSARALVGLTLGLHAYRHWPLSPKVHHRIDALKEQPYWHENLRTLQLELIRARDTERITRKMRDEVIPEVMKHSSDLMRKIKDAAADEDTSVPEENPEWEKLFEKSGLRKKLEEMNELQMEGSDVMMSAFAHLKSNSFFRNVSHWFLPFDSGRSELKSVMSDSRTQYIASMMSSLPILCDSDKYSFFFAISDVPENQRAMMYSQYTAQAENIADMTTGATTVPATARRAINNYLHDIYRFYKLFRRKNEFTDVFAEPVMLMDVDILSDTFMEEEPARLIAELYFKCHDYAQALKTFTAYLDFAPPSAEVFQKIGYCRERLGEYSHAMEAYRQAELFNADNEWNVRRMAAVAKILGNTSEALKYYLKLSEMRPEDVTVALNLGNTYAADEQFDKAVGQYYKVTFLDESSQKPWRPLAWCLFVIREFDKSAGYYKKILDGDPMPDDYLNVGHLCLARGDMSGALENYKLSISKGDGSFDTFSRKMKADTPYLAKAGIDVAEIPIIADAVYYAVNPC